MERNKFKATFIFDEFQRLENRLPLKKEFDEWFYGYPNPKSKYYYQVKKKWLNEESDEK